MNKQDRIYVVWDMNGAYYDAIMNSCPAFIKYARKMETHFGLKEIYIPEVDLE